MRLLLLVKKPLFNTVLLKRKINFKARQTHGAFVGAVRELPEHFPLNERQNCIDNKSIVMLITVPRIHLFVALNVCLENRLQYSTQTTGFMVCNFYI